MISVVGQFFKNIVTTYLGTMVSLTIVFFFTPYLISMLGKNRYGIWQLTFSILSYMGLADMGMKQSIVRYISKYYATKDWKQLNEVFSSAVRIYMIISIFIGLVVVVIAFSLLDNFKLPSEYFDIAQKTLLILGLDYAITYFFIPFTALGGFHRFDIGNYLRLARQIIQTLIIVVLLELGYGLVVMALLVLVLNFVYLLGMNGYRIHNYPEVRFSRSSISREKTKVLFKYGIFSFLIVVTWIIIFQTDNIVIGWFISMEAVTLYSVVAAIVSQIRGAINIIAVPLVPTVSHFESEGSFEKIQKIYAKSTRYLYYISGYICITALLYGDSFILLWLGEEFMPSVEILYILIVAGAIFFPQMIANSILFGISKHKVAFYILGIEALANIILSIILVQYWGIVGVAYGTAIPQLIIYIFIYPYFFHKTIAVKVKSFYYTAVRSLGLALAILVPSAYLTKKLLIPDSWHILILDGIIITVIAFIGLIKYILEADDRERLTDKLRSIFFKKHT